LAWRSMVALDKELYQEKAIQREIGEKEKRLEEE
jgi:hypothetical protein